MAVESQAARYNHCAYEISISFLDALCILVDGVFDDIGHKY